MRFRGLLHRWEINSAFLHAHKARRRARVERNDALCVHSHNRSPPASHPCHLQPRRMTHFAFIPRWRAHVAAPASPALSISIAFTRRMARGSDIIRGHGRVLEEGKTTKEKNPEKLMKFIQVWQTTIPGNPSESKSLEMSHIRATVFASNGSARALREECVVLPHMAPRK